MKSVLPADETATEGNEIRSKYGSEIEKYREEPDRNWNVSELMDLNARLSADLNSYETKVSELEDEVDSMTDRYEGLNRESEKLFADLEKRRRRLRRDRDFDRFVNEMKEIEGKRMEIQRSVGCEDKPLKSRNDLLESIRFLDEFNKELTGQIDLLSYIIDNSHSLNEKKKEIGRKILEKDREMEKLTESIMKINKEGQQLETKFERKRRKQIGPGSPPSGKLGKTEKKVVKPILGEKKISKSDYDAIHGARALSSTLPGLTLPNLKPLDETTESQSRTESSRRKHKRESDSELSCPNLSATLNDLNSLLFKITDAVIESSKGAQTMRQSSPGRRMRQTSPFAKTLPSLGQSPMRLSAIDDDSDIDPYAYVRTNSLIQQEIEDKIVLKKIQKKLDKKKAERRTLKEQIERSTPKLGMSDKFGFSVLEDPICQTGRGFGQRTISTQTLATGDIIDFHMNVLKEQEQEREENRKLKAEIAELEEQARALTSQIIATGIEGKRVEVQIGKIQSVFESVKGNTQTNISLRAVVGADIDQNMERLKTEIKEKSAKLEEFAKKTESAEKLLKALHEQREELDIEVYEMDKGEDPQIKDLESEIRSFVAKRNEAKQKLLKTEEEILRKKATIDEMRQSEAKKRYRKLVLRRINLERRIQKWKMLLQDTKDSIQVLEQFSTDRRDRRQALRDAVEKYEQVKFDKEEDLREMDRYRQLLEDLLNQHNQA